MFQMWFLLTSSDTGNIDCSEFERGVTWLKYAKITNFKVNQALSSNVSVLLG